MAMIENESYHLSIPARAEAALVARMALSAVGALCGLDIDLIGDLRTATSECCDCLLHQGRAVNGIDMDMQTTKDKLSIAFRAQRGEPITAQPALGLDVTRGILETLLPQVAILSDEHGVYGFDLALSL